MKNNENQSPLVSRALEKYRTSDYSVAVTDFFSPGDRMEIFKELCTVSPDAAGRCFFWGGARGAERCTAVFLPDWYMPDTVPPHRMPNDEDRTVFFSSYLKAHSEILTEIPVKAVKISGSGFTKLSHRDYMGSVLALGIDRSVIGDIIPVSDSEAIVFVSDRIAPYITSELTKIGRDGVKAAVTGTDPEWTVPRKYELLSITVSSPRLDGIVKAITGLSREDSAELVRNGMVELSYAATLNVSKDVNDGDIVSVRGYGKYLIGKITGETKSGRLKIECRKYI